MLRSMTGFGQSIRAAESHTFTVDMKSVNHRHLDIMFRLPREWQQAEDVLRRLIQSRLHRGRIEVTVSAERSENRPRQAVIDWALAEAYRDAGKALANRLHLRSSELTLKDFLELPDVIRFQETADAVQGLEQLIQCAEEALDRLVAMREAEGRFLAEDVRAKCSSLAQIVDRMERIAPAVVEQYRSRLHTKLEQLGDAAGTIDPARLAMEVAILAERSAIDEELTRLRSHTEQFVSLFERNEPTGRKLDFLLQEMNREANTIGAKANHLELSNLVVDAKAEIERLREQAQNIE